MILGGQLAVRAVGHTAHRAGVDEQHLALAVPVLAGAAALRQEPQARRDLCGAEELTRQRDDAIHEVRLDDALPYLPFARLVRGHRAVGEDEADGAAGGEVVQEVLHPGEVRVAHRRERRRPSAGRPAAARHPSPRR